MAAIPRMMSAAREEVVVVTNELANVSRAAAVEGAVAERSAVVETMNPVAVRRAAEANVNKAVGESSSLLSRHLSPASAPSSVTNTTIQTTNTLTALSSSTITTTSGTATRTLVGKTLEEDLGVTLKEVMSNATQTGVEEQLDTIQDAVKHLARDNAPAVLAKGSMI